MNYEKDILIVRRYQDIFSKNPVKFEKDANGNSCHQDFRTRYESREIYEKLKRIID